MRKIGNKVLALLLAMLIAAGTLLVPASAAPATDSAVISECSAERGGIAEITFKVTLSADVAYIASRWEGDSDDFDEGRLSFKAPDDFDVGSLYVRQTSPWQCFSIYADEASSAMADSDYSKMKAIPAGEYTFKLRLHVDAATEEDLQTFTVSFSFKQLDGSMHHLRDIDWELAVTDPASGDDLLHGGETLTAGGSYALADDAAGIITIDTAEEVTVSGSGVAWDANYNYTDDTVKYENLKFDCTVPGAQLTLRDMFLEDRADTSPLLNFTGTGNQLNIEGTVVMDKYGTGRGTYANIHVPEGSELTLGGAGTLYLYKTSGGAGIGGSSGEMNGELTFAMTGAAFIKGTKQGAVIGAGTGARGNGTPGRVTFTSGTYNLISNSRAAVIGGSAGGEGASEGTEVYFRGGSVNINTDYSGSSVGGGGYDAGNDSSGGSVFITGGSLRIYVDKNAAVNVGSTGYYKGLPMPEGVNNVSMTALRTTEAGDPLYLCIVDTAGVAPDADGNYTVKVDGKVYYTGGLHEYGFIQEGLDKGEQHAVTSTVSNWYQNGETRLFVYLTGEDHKLQLNDEPEYTVSFNEAAVDTIDECNGNAFSAAPKASITLDRTELHFTKLEATQQLTATVIPEGTAVTWKSSDDTVATVDETGLVTAHKDGSAIITATAGEVSAECAVTVLAGSYAVSVYPTVSDANITLSDGIGYTYRETTHAGAKLAAEGDTPAGEAFYLLPGNYTVTITKSGYYASEFSFALTEEGKIVFPGKKTVDGTNLKQFVNSETNSFTIPMHVFTPSTNAGAWDGLTLDVSWYNDSAAALEISTPAQLAGMAAIVNGIYNAEITTILDDADGDGTVESYTPAEYAKLANRKIVAAASTGDTSGPNGNNLVTTDTYWYGAKADGHTPADFRNQTIRIMTDLDMGGHQDGNGSWTGARYMTIGGQSLMHYISYGAGDEKYSDGLSHLGASFNGRLDGQGHLIKNLYCDRYGKGSNFGDSQSVGLVGRLGIHDNDYSNWKADNTKGNYPAVNPSVRNLAVSGYVYARRSVGAIVGKIGQTSASNLGDGTLGGLIENCVNFATVHNTDSKGCGGIVGASWNRGVVRGCVNFGAISTIYRNPTGGIVGSNEIPLANCYNMGQISATNTRYAMAIGTNNGGGSDVRNCFWLTGSAPGGGYYGSMTDKTQVKEITDNYNGTTLTAAEFMQSEDFVGLLNGTTSRTFKQAASTDAIYALLTAAGCPGAPVPRVFTQDTTTMTKIDKSGEPKKLTYVEGERFDPTGLEIRAYWSDGSSEVLENYTYEPNGELKTTDTRITVSVSAGGQTASFSFDITVVPVSLQSLSLWANPTRRVYNEGETFDPAGTKIKITYTNGKTATAEWKDGRFVDSADANKVYDTMKFDNMVGAPLTAVQNGKAAIISYTFAGDTKTVDTDELTVIAAAGKPKQEGGVYLVGTPAELDWIAAQVNNALEPGLKAKLTADITASADFTPIGADRKPFTGEFDGNGHKVTLNITTGTKDVALFGYIENATIKNTISAGTVAVDGKNGYIAGLVGHVSGSCLIENCGNEANISCTNGSSTPIGGLVGGAETRNCELVIRGCYNRGDVTGVHSSNTRGSDVGGIIGLLAKNCKVENCYNWGDITGCSGGLEGVGGIVGSMKDYAKITNVYSAGKIKNLYTDEEGYEEKFGAAIVGRVSNAEDVTNYYWLEGTSVNSIGDYNPTAGGKLTSAELQAKESDLGEAFKHYDNYYPLLTWQKAEHTHVWDEGTVTKEPTCSEKGSAAYKCTERFCLAEETRDVDMLPHTWGEWIQTKTPTCTEKGEETRTCGVCKATETRDVDIVPHNWGEWTQTKVPTCTEKGEETRTCSAGHETETRDVGALGHKDGNHDYRCDVCNAVLKDAPKLIQGEGQKWEKGSSRKLSFSTDADRADFLGLDVDGAALAQDAYTLSDAGTLVTLPASYLETLGVGKHTLRILSRNGAVEVTFEVLAAQSATPRTGDAAMPALYLSLAALSLAALLLLWKKRNAGRA